MAPNPSAPSLAPAAFRSDASLAHNHDIALPRLHQTRAERAQIVSAAMPEVSFDGAGEAVRGSKALSSQPGGRARTWRLGFDASWELDLFGGTRRAVEAADVGIHALAEAERLAEHAHRGGLGTTSRSAFARGRRRPKSSTILQRTSTRHNRDGKHEPLAAGAWVADKDRQGRHPERLSM